MMNKEGFSLHSKMESRDFLHITEYRMQALQERLHQGTLFAIGFTIASAAIYFLA